MVIFLVNTFCAIRGKHAYVASKKIKKDVQPTSVCKKHIKSFILVKNKVILTLRTKPTSCGRPVLRLF